MKKGDEVVIIDGSFSRSVINGKLEKEWLNCSTRKDAYGPVKNRKYVIVETNCVFPNTGSSGYGFVYYEPPTYNNTVIQDTLSGKVVFIEERFLRLAEHTISIDGKSIKISHEFYENLKKQLL